VERAEQSGGLHKRSAEAWGNSLRARGAELPLGVFYPFLGAGRCVTEDSVLRKSGSETDHFFGKSLALIENASEGLRLISRSSEFLLRGLSVGPFGSCAAV
jgi:hypothetical protein